MKKGCTILLDRSATAGRRESISVSKVPALLVKASLNLDWIHGLPTVC
jgi:hypothetical protein